MWGTSRGASGLRVSVLLTTGAHAVYKVPQAPGALCRKISARLGGQSLAPGFPDPQYRLLPKQGWIEYTLQRYGRPSMRQPLIDMVNPLVYSLRLVLEQPIDVEA